MGFRSLIRRVIHRDPYPTVIVRDPYPTVDPYPTIGETIETIGYIKDKLSNHNNTSSVTEQEVDVSVKTAGELSVNIVHRSSVDELSNVSPQFSFLRNSCFPENNDIRWNMGGVDTYCLQVMFIGKTGYGKSTTLNRICGQNYFKTDEIESCTKKLYSSEYKLVPYREQYLSLCDLPGIGESLKTDPQYGAWYFQMVRKSACIVYLLRADQRDFSVDEIILKLLRESNSIHKTIVGLNYADKIEPIAKVSSYPFQPNEEQMSNLEKKRTIISQVLQIPPENSIYYSAKDGYNANLLIQKIEEVLKKAVNS